MRIKLLVETVWNVAPEDEDKARKLLEEQPQDVILGMIRDAAAGSHDLEPITGVIQVA